MKKMLAFGTLLIAQSLAASLDNDPMVASRSLASKLTIPTTSCKTCKEHAHTLENAANKLVYIHHIASNAVKTFQRKEEPQPLNPLMMACMASLYCINAPSLLSYETDGNFPALTDEATSGKEFINKLKSLIANSLPDETSATVETNCIQRGCGEIHYKLYITKYKTNAVANLVQNMLQTYLQAQISSGVSYETFKNSVESFEAAALIEMLYAIDNNHADSPHIMDVARTAKTSATTKINRDASGLTERTQTYQSRSWLGKIWNVTELLLIYNLQKRIPELKKISVDLIGQDETQSPIFNRVMNNLPKNRPTGGTPFGIWEQIDLIDLTNSESE